MVPPAVPRPAATVVLLRPAAGGGFEVLLTQRPSTMAFAPDVHVFPGGAVEPTDGSAEAAALRELDEEAGIRLPSADLLAPISRWVTPPFVERRFDVRFFCALLPDGVEPRFDPSEVAAHRWLTPRQAIDGMAAGDIGMWVPTSTTLQQLEHVRTFEEIRARLAPGAEEPIELERLSPSLVRVGLSAAGAVAGQRTSSYVIGRRELIVVDPGDPSDAAIDALLAIASDAGAGPPASIGAVVLTSAAPDHAAGAEALAGRLDPPPPIFGGPGVGRDLAFQVIELADGDRVPAGDVEVVAMTTPGPRPEHLALVVAPEEVVIAGDLFGPGPSRSVPPAVDDELVAQSRARVAALGGRVLAAHRDEEHQSAGSAAPRFRR